MELLRDALLIKDYIEDKDQLAKKIQERDQIADTDPATRNLYPLNKYDQEIYMEIKAHVELAQMEVLDDEGSTWSQGSFSKDIDFRLLERLSLDFYNKAIIKVC